MGKSAVNEKQVSLLLELSILVLRGTRSEPVCLYSHQARSVPNITESKDKGHPCTGTEALYRPYGP